MKMATHCWRVDYFSCSLSSYYYIPSSVLGLNTTSWIKGLMEMFCCVLYKIFQGSYSIEHMRMTTLEYHFACLLNFLNEHNKPQFVTSLYWWCKHLTSFNYYCWNLTSGLFRSLTWGLITFLAWTEYARLNYPHTDNKQKVAWVSIIKVILIKLSLLLCK